MLLQTFSAGHCKALIEKLKLEPSEDQKNGCSYLEPENHEKP